MYILLFFPLFIFNIFILEEHTDLDRAFVLLLSL